MVNGVAEISVTTLDKIKRILELKPEAEPVGWLNAVKLGRDVYYINHRLIALLSV